MTDWIFVLYNVFDNCISDVINGAMLYEEFAKQVWTFDDILLLNLSVLLHMEMKVTYWDDLLTARGRINCLALDNNDTTT